MSSPVSSIERHRLAGTAAEGSTADADVLARLLAERFSCRAFRPEPVPDAVIERMLGIAQMSPSWCNTQPWQVTVLSGAATGRLRAALLADLDSGARPEPDIPFPAAYSAERLARRREVAWQLYESAGIARGDRTASARQARENERLFGAPHVLLIHSSRELGTYGAVDCGIYLAALMLAAQALGLGMIPQAALARHSDVIRQMLDTPDDQMFVVGASFGFADEGNPVNQFRSRRAPLSATVTKVSE